MLKLCSLTVKALQQAIRLALMKALKNHLGYAVVLTQKVAKMVQLSYNFLEQVAENLSAEGTVESYQYLESQRARVLQ
ncbi:hypothetical protein V3564_05355 [Bartonella sp. B12(2025)]